MCLLLILVSKPYQSPFRGWLITATTSRNHSAISQKEAIESPEIERFWSIKYQTKDKICKQRRENSGDLFRSYPS